MFRYSIAVLAAVILIAVSSVSNEALAFRGGRGGGFHGGGARVAHVGGAYRGRAVHAGRYAHVSRPIARHPAARTAARRGAYRTAYRRGAYRGAAYGAVGAAAVGAAAAGAYGYYNNCHYDTYGNWICPQY